MKKIITLLALCCITLGLSRQSAYGQDTIVKIDTIGANNNIIIKKNIIITSTIKLDTIKMPFASETTNSKLLSEVIMATKNPYFHLHTHTYRINNFLQLEDTEKLYSYNQTKQGWNEPVELSTSKKYSLMICVLCICISLFIISYASPLIYVYGKIYKYIILVIFGGTFLGLSGLMFCVSYATHNAYGNFEHFKDPTIFNLILYFGLLCISVILGDYFKPRKDK